MCEGFASNCCMSLKMLRELVWRSSWLYSYIYRIEIISIFFSYNITLNDDEGDKQLFLFIVVSRVSFFVKPENRGEKKVQDWVELIY